MHIAFDAKRLFHNRTGLGNYGRFVVNSCQQYFPENQYSLVSKTESSLFDKKNADIISPKGIWKKSPFNQIWRIYGVQNDLEKQKIDIYHGLSNEIPFSLKKTPTVVSLHDLLFKRFPNLYKPIDRSIYDIKSGYACRNADKIIAISQQTANDIVKYYGVDEKKIQVVYQSCHKIFQQKMSEELKENIKKTYQLPNEFILCVGTIEERKNAHILVEALALLKGKIEIPLVLVGRKTHYWQKIEKIIQANGLSKQIICISNLNGVENLAAMYQMATIFAYPSIFEGFGIPILEALHSGVPVITSAGSCFPETGGEAALYADAHDAAAWAENILRLLDDNKLKIDLKEKAKVQVLKFEERKLTNELMQIYKDLC